MFAILRALARKWRATRRKRQFNRIKNKPLPCIPANHSDSLRNRLSFWKRRSQSHRGSKGAPSPPIVTCAPTTQGAGVRRARFASGAFRAEKRQSWYARNIGHYRRLVGESGIVRRLEASPGPETKHLLRNYLEAIRSSRERRAIRNALEICCPRHAEDMSSESTLSSYVYEPGRPCSRPCLVNSPTSRYDVQFRLGTGATCHVVCAKVVVQKQPMTTETVAIKVFHKRQLAYYTLSKKAKSSFAECLARERDMLVAITESRSRYLTPLFEAFQDKHNVYFVLKPYPLSLSDLIGLMRDLGKRLTVGAIKFYASELLVAIEQLHSLNIAHRDIKPENILISSSGHLALADFGLSVRIPPDDQRPFTKQIRYDAVGTPAYCAPELWRADVSKKGYLVAASDIWMYGAVVLQMWLSKRIPFFSPEGEDRGVMFDMYQLVEYPVVADFLSSIIHAPEDLRPYIPTIKAHKFFATINWHSVCNRFDDQERSPPFVLGDFLRHECYPSVGFSTFYRECSFSKLPSSDRETALADSLTEFLESNEDIVYRCSRHDRRYYVTLT